MPFDPYPAPSPTIHYKSCKPLDIYSHMKTIASYKLITFKLNCALILIIMWSLFLLWDEVSLKINYVRFQSSLLMLPKTYGTKLPVKYYLDWYLYFYTFVSIFDTYILIFMLDKSFTLFFPGKAL